MNVCGNASILSLTADKAASRAGEVCLAQARHHPRLLQELAQTIFRGGIHGIEASSADVRPATGLLRCPGRLVIRDGLHYGRALRHARPARPAHHAGGRSTF
jgi:hypothetical protein